MRHVSLHLSALRSVCTGASVTALQITCTRALLTTQLHGRLPVKPLLTVFLLSSRITRRALPYSLPGYSAQLPELWHARQGNSLLGTGYS